MYNLFADPPTYRYTATAPESDFASLLKAQEEAQLWPNEGQTQLDTLRKAWTWKSKITGLEPGLYLRVLALSAPLAETDLTNRVWYPFQSDVKHKLPLADRLVGFLCTYPFKTTHYTVLSQIRDALGRIRCCVLHDVKWTYDYTAIRAVDEQIVQIMRRLQPKDDPGGVQYGPLTLEGLQSEYAIFVSCEAEARKRKGEDIFNRLVDLAPLQYLALLSDISPEAPESFIHLVQLPLSPDYADEWLAKLQPVLKAPERRPFVRHQALQALALLRLHPWPSAKEGSCDQLGQLLLDAGCEDIVELDCKAWAEHVLKDKPLAAGCFLHQDFAEQNLPRLLSWIEECDAAQIPLLCKLTRLKQSAYVSTFAHETACASAKERIFELVKQLNGQQLWDLLLQPESTECLQALDCFLDLTAAKEYLAQLFEYDLLYSMRCCVEAKSALAAALLLPLFDAGWRKRCRALTDTGKANICDVGDFTPDELILGIEALLKK